MTTQRKTYVKFVKPLSPDKQRLDVQTLKGDVLGFITYYAPWRQHVFVPDWDTEFSFDCLEDIAAQVKAMNTGSGLKPYGTVEEKQGTMNKTVVTIAVSGTLGGNEVYVNGRRTNMAAWMASVEDRLDALKDQPDLDATCWHPTAGLVWSVGHRWFQGKEVATSAQASCPCGFTMSFARMPSVATKEKTDTP